MMLSLPLAWLDRSITTTARHECKSECECESRGKGEGEDGAHQRARRSAAGTNQPRHPLAGGAMSDGSTCCHFRKPQVCISFWRHTQDMEHSKVSRSSQVLAHCATLNFTTLNSVQIHQVCGWMSGKALSRIKVQRYIRREGVKHTRQRVYISARLVHGA